MHSPKRRSDSAHPGSSLMSKEKMTEYLHDLRANRPTRPQPPAGSRPFVSHSTRSSVASDAGSGSYLPRLSHSSSGSDKTFNVARSSSSLSHRQSLNLSLSTRSSSDDRRSSGYHERNERQKEITEVRDVRLALEQTDLEIERRVVSAAREEADELVRKHKEAGAPYRVASQPENYTQIRRPTSVDSLEPLEKESDYGNSTRLDLDAVSEALPQIKKRSSYSKLANYWNNTGLGNRRRSSGSRRSVSGKQKGIFVNPEDKIYEDPLERSSPAAKTAPLPPPQPQPQRQIQNTEPAHMRRNPFARARSVKQALPDGNETPTFEYKPPVITEVRDEGMPQDAAFGTISPMPITRNSHTVQPDEVHQDDAQYKGGMEVRSAELRAATSMRFKDRSVKLPSPTAVSDSPNRPIVSFKPDWTPPKVEDRSPSKTAGTRPPLPGVIQDDKTPEPVKSASSPAVPTLQNMRTPSIQINNGRMSPIMSMPKHPTADYKVPAIPSNTPRISISGPPEINYDAVPSIPSKNSSWSQTHVAPMIVVEDSTPTMKEEKSPRDAELKNASSPRYSAFPKPRPMPTHWSTAPVLSTPPSSMSVRRTTALCAQCALPISGKVVSAAGLRFHPGCFTCYNCGEGLECVDFYPEPAEKRAGRIDRIQKRLNGEMVDEKEGEGQADDGDDSLRFYCHLDFHEFFSPRCKSCKTPIEGQVVVACGAEWHVGHFFCAQCGDPFDPTTPFVEKDGYAWCIECHTNRYSAKCKKCRRPVTSMVVQALGGEWHDECFCCTICSGNFEDGRFFLQPGSQDPVCMACEERRLKA